jgi:hypothetical protein
MTLGRSAAQPLGLALLVSIIGIFRGMPARRVAGRE